MRGVVLAAVLLALAATQAAADPQVDGLVAALNQAGSGAAKDDTIAGVARAVGSSPDALRSEQAASGLPVGDVFAAHRVASRAGLPVERVFAARKRGATWKDIAVDANVGEETLARDLLAAFPKLTPIEVPVAAPSPPAPPAEATSPAAGGAPPGASQSPSGGPPPTTAAPEPEKKRGIGSRFRDLFKGDSAGEPAKDAAKEAERKRQEELRDFTRGQRPR